MVTVLNGVNGQNGKTARNHVVKGKRSEIENVLDLATVLGITPLLMSAMLANVLNGTNGAHGEIATLFVTVAIEKEPDHALDSEIVWAKVQIQTRAIPNHVLIGHHGDRGVIAVHLVVRELDPKIASAKEKAIARELKVKLRNVKLVSFIFFLSRSSLIRFTICWVV